LWPVLEVPRRITFVISPMRVIHAVFSHQIQVSKHSDDVLALIQRLRTEPPLSRRVRQRPRP
jgi:peroxiredoxin